MNHDITEELLIDYLSGEVTNEVARKIEAAASNDRQLNTRLQELRLLMADIQQRPQPAPSGAADQRFADFLAMAAESPERRLRVKWRYLAAAAAVLLVFALGWYGGSQQNDTENALAANRALMLELMQHDRTSQRIRATTVALEAGQQDTALIDNLIYLLNTDDNTNVQLAALGVLLRFAERNSVQDAMLKAIDAEHPMIVKLQLIESLVRLENKRVLPYLKEIQDNEKLPQSLRDAARMGTFKLT